MNECRLCRRQFDDTASLLKHNRLVHKCKSPPKRIQILGRLGDRAPRNDLYVPTPYRVWERVQRRPTDPAERLPRAVGVPMRARRIRKRPGMMRGLRKPASNEWHRAVAAQWLRSEWRDGRLLANDKKGVNFWDFDHDQTVREEVTEQDVWWRRSIVQPAVVSDDTPLDLSKRGCLAVNPSKGKCTDYSTTTNSYQIASQHSPTILKWIHKRRLVCLPVMKPAACLPAFDALINESVADDDDDDDDRSHDV